VATQLSKWNMTISVHFVSILTVYITTPSQTTYQYCSPSLLVDQISTCALTHTGK